MSQKKQLVTTPARIRLKRSIFKALTDFQTDFLKEYKFVVKQDSVSFLKTFDWNENQRLVVLYMNDVSNEFAYDSGVETASFEFFCVVSPDQNDDTVAFEALNLLVDQIRCCIWGCGANLGMNKVMPSDMKLIGYTQFKFNPDIENRISTERIVSHGVIPISISYEIAEYSDVQEMFGAGVGVIRQ